MKTKFVALVTMAASLFLTTPGVASADGIIIPHPPPHLPPVILPYLAVKYHRVQVTINNQVAVTRVDQVFVNDTDRDLEGTYIFPLPEEAAISDFAMYVDGQRLEGKILDKNQARQIYEQIVRGRRDPALLEYVGRNAFRASIFPIPARGEKRVQLEYSQVLPADRGLVRYLYPLNTEKFSSRPLQEVTIHVQITSREQIKAVYSPSHPVAIKKTDAHAAEASYEQTNVKPDRDFLLYYTVSPQDFGLNLLTYRERGEDGFFLLLVAPKYEFERVKILPKDVIFVLDTSGSMQGKKLSQAKEALRYVLDNLNDFDRFNVIAFNTAVTRYADGLVPAAQRGEARRFVDGLVASGGTNISQALTEAMKDADAGRPAMIIFLTDGLPTAGLTDPQQILDSVKRVAGPSTRLFVFGVGDDVNTTLLDTLAQNHRGTSEYVRPGEDLEDRLSGFYTKISLPVLSDLELGFGRIRVHDMYPDPLPDLFQGSQLVLLGRYRNDGAATVTLAGRLGDRPRRFEYEDVVFPKESRANDFIPRLWATRKIGYLLTQIRLHGQNKELVDEIVALSLRYGIMTPYTSFLVDERHNLFAAGGPERAAEDLHRMMARPAPTSGPQAVLNSQGQKELRQAETTVTSPEIKPVGEKTFILRQEVWTDSTYREGMKLIKINFGGEDYFKLLAANPQWGKYFALGKQVIVVLDGVAYQVAEGNFSSVTVPTRPTPSSSIIPPVPDDNLLARLWRWVKRLVET